ELEDQKKAQEEREKTFNNQVKKYEDNKRNTEQIVQWLVGMQPQAAVEKLMAMPDQQVIDVLRQAEEDAQASGTASSTAYWLQLMPDERVGQLMRKMQSKPTTLDE
ncbi:MAG TPA: flagellar protein FlbB, partial [Treponema sp.]|nr:flagellar protein FlbB [Treponema sp.]